MKDCVSVLFNEPKLLKFELRAFRNGPLWSFSALQRAEIAEICATRAANRRRCGCFSALQRAEIAEIKLKRCSGGSWSKRFSALQRAEIAEISAASSPSADTAIVSVLFNEPKLLKFDPRIKMGAETESFSALQRAEIAEIYYNLTLAACAPPFQCSSTSRNC